MEYFNLKWYQILVENGVANTLASNFTNYSPAYTYLLAIASLTRSFIPPLVAVKLIPTFFDMVSAFLISKIVKTKYPQGNMPFLAASLYLTAPTIVLNSTYWGQADSLYVAFLLLCVYCLLINKTTAAMFAMGIAFSIKAQAIFIAPLILVLVLQGKIPWKLILVPPLVYILTALPVILLGRDILDVLSVYTNQASTYNILSVNAPNPYILFSRESYLLIMPYGLTLTAILITCWIYSTYNAKTVSGPKSIILVATISTALLPFLLPKMHDRYFYPTDVLSIVLAFFMPELWFIPVLYQIISFSSISIFLFSADDTAVASALLLNIPAIAMLLKAQRVNGLLQRTKSTTFTRLLWTATVSMLTPILLAGIGFSFVASLPFFRIENKVSTIRDLQNPLSPTERFVAAKKIHEYFTDKTGLERLYREDLDNGIALLTKNDAYFLQDIKIHLSLPLKIWHVALLGMYTISLLAWAWDSLSLIRKGVNAGGWLTAAVATIIAVMIYFFQFKGLFRGIFPSYGPDPNSSLRDVFPAPIFSDASILLFIFLITSGTMLGLWLRERNVP
jgi:Gpi18-like mannosyltransferase